MRLPQLQRVTRCGAPAMNIVQLPFSEGYVHLSVDCIPCTHNNNMFTLKETGRTLI